jgi:hypothetical protein
MVFNATFNNISFHNKRWSASSLCNISTEQTIILAILVFENDRELIPVGNYKFQMPNSFLDLIVPIKVILRHVFANLFLLRQVCQSYL